MSIHRGNADAGHGQTTVRARATDAVAGIDRNERYFQALFENGLDAFVVLSETARFMDANPAACQLIGFARHELIGRSVAETIETGSDFESAWSKFKREGKYRGQRWMVRPDGTRRLIEIRATANVLPARHLAIWRDVTDRYFLESQLLQKERDEALARLAGGIAHDLTNLLNVIGGHTELMTRQIATIPDANEHVERILVATQQAAALTAQLSALARQQVLCPAVLDLSAFVHSCGGALRSLVPENVELILPEMKNCAPIRVDRTQMAQVIFTFASTAGELLPKGGHLRVEIRNATLKQPLAKPGFHIPAGNYVVLEFRTRAKSDHCDKLSLPLGPFSSPNHRVHAALPGVTATVKQNHGFVWVDANSAEGASLSVYFPTMIGHALAEPEPEQGGGRGGSETILLAEDDPALREATREYLKCIGYRVLPAGNGEEALQAAQSAGRIDAVIADLRMPKMGGKELAEKMVLTVPEIKVMFVSGNIDRELIQRPPGEEGPALLSKPFEMRVLASTLRDLLDGKPRS